MPRILSEEVGYTSVFPLIFCLGDTVPLTLNGPIATKVVCFSRLLKCLRSLYGKQCGPRSDCSYRSSLFWVHAVCFYTNSSVVLVNYLQRTTSVDDIFRCIFLGALRVKIQFWRSFVSFEGHIIFFTQINMHWS